MQVSKIDDNSLYGEFSGLGQTSSIALHVTRWALLWNLNDQQTE